MEQLRDAFEANRLTSAQLFGDRYFRMKHIRALQVGGLLDESLRWTRSANAAPLKSVA